MPGLLDPQKNWGAKFGSDAPVTTGLLATVPASGLLAPPQAELRSYQPTPREWLHNQFTQFFGGGAHGASAADPSQPAVGSKPVTPWTYGYGVHEVPWEYTAEAIRAYMTNPNYLKTVAPRTAARIRAMVNANPYLSKIIQFNGIAAAPAISDIPQQQDTSGQ